MSSYAGKKVLVTGHTGFKGSWLSIWLRLLGADVVGFSLPPPTSPSNFAITGLEGHLTHQIGDVRDYEAVERVIGEHQPEIIFHLAALSIVLDSYDLPKETFDTNAGGTVNLLEAVRKTSSVRAVVVVTTDKCYENEESLEGYREGDRLGGHDPYSASKSMAELVVASYRDALFKDRNIQIATARAGNVIGGGDFSPFRLLPDCMRALMKGKPVQVRHPDSVRPWLHVLDPLAGYLQLGEALLKGDGYAEAWNFGPKEIEAVSVGEIADTVVSQWGDGHWITVPTEGPKREMGLLRLNWDKAAERLRWQPTYSWEEAIEETVDWYRAYQQEADMHAFSVAQIESQIRRRQSCNSPQHP